MSAQITEAEDREDQERVSRVQGSQLLSLTQGANLCPGSGFNSNNDCGDEIEPDQELCKSCQRVEDEFFVERDRERDREPVISSQYFK